MLSSLTPISPPSSDDVVKDVVLATFKADVLDTSKQCLVLVDFWAAWCGPCKQLTPLLEKLARESNGAVRLAKIDVDKNQPLAQQMGVQSVPSVFAFFQGRPIDAFAGALPEAQIKTWLEQLLQQTGGTGDPDKAGLESALKQAADYLDHKDITTAHAIYIDVLDQDPANAAAYTGLIRCLLAEGQIAKARRTFDSVPAGIAKDKLLSPVRAALELAEQVGQGAGQEAELESRLAKNPDDHQTRFDLALACYAAGKRETAVDHLLEIIRRNRAWNEDAARKQLVKFFEAFGVMDPLSVSARKRLSSMLFS